MEGSLAFSNQIFFNNQLFQIWNVTNNFMFKVAKNVISCEELPHHNCLSSSLKNQNRHMFLNSIVIYSWLSRCSSARGSSNGLYLIGPTKLSPIIIFHLREVPIKFKIINNCLILLSHFLLIGQSVNCL